MQLDDPEQDNTAFCVIKFGDQRQAQEERPAEDIPVLTVPESAEVPEPAHQEAEAPVVEASK